MAFHVGQRVLCVNDSLALATNGGRRRLEIVKGRIYTVRWVGSYLAEAHLSLEEVCRESDVPFRAIRFRPLSETRLDIFRQMLVSPPKVEEPSPAWTSDTDVPA